MARITALALNPSRLSDAGIAPRELGQTFPGIRISYPNYPTLIACVGI